MNTLKNLFTVLIASSALFLSASVAMADDDVVLCAAVTPCGIDGDVLPEFNNGPCAEVYAAECDLSATSSQRTEKLKIAKAKQQVAQCTSTLRSVKKQTNWRLSRANRRIQQLESQLRAALSHQ